MRFLDLALLEPPQQTRPGLTARRGPHHCVILARHYTEVLRQLCRRDFRRHYRQEEGELAAKIRGRLYVAGQLRNRLRGRVHRAPCRWEEFTADNWDNRILLGAARALERAARDIGSHAAAARVRAYFSEARRRASRR
jgi:5-methylcytosine-specific restriction endonuclease McrBC regulatory subunit McrC